MNAAWGALCWWAGRLLSEIPTLHWVNQANEALTSSIRAKVAIDWGGLWMGDLQTHSLFFPPPFCLPVIKAGLWGLLLTRQCQTCKWNINQNVVNYSGIICLSVLERFSIAVVADGGPTGICVCVCEREHVSQQTNFLTTVQIYLAYSTVSTVRDTLTKTDRNSLKSLQKLQQSSSRDSSQS